MSDFDFCEVCDGTGAGEGYYNDGGPRPCTRCKGTGTNPPLPNRELQQVLADALNDSQSDAEAKSTPQKGVEEAIARTKAKYPKTMAALADTHDNASDVSVPQKGVDHE